MKDDGLTETSKETTSVPTMYVEVEQDENVARGHIKVIEIIAYDQTDKPQRYYPEKLNTLGEIKKDKSGNVLYQEKGREPYFCQDPEDILIFQENNPKARLEQFTIQVLKSTAIKYLNSPRNIEQFTRKGA